MNVHPRSRNRSRNPSFLAMAAAGLALAAVGWAVGLIPVGDERSFGESAAAWKSAPVTDSAESLAGGALGTPPEAVIADCNRFAAEVQSASASDDSGAALEGATGVGADASGPAAGEVDADLANAGAEISGAASASAGSLYGLNPENARNESARSAYGDCMLENGFRG